MNLMKSLVLLLAGLCYSTDVASGWAIGESSTRSSGFGQSRTTLRSSSNDNNNCVLKPSTSPDAFDNFKIGGARVHRIQRGSGSEDAEYVMWYHGRSSQLDENDDLRIPPLSTGRIGQATSRNGLVWTKVTQGSESEDADDVSLGLNNESWWGFDTTHVGLGQVMLPLSTPAVMTEGGVFLMYYFGGSGEETNVVDYLDMDDPPESLLEKKIAGMNMKIGIALSQDGKTWGRVEGDDPTGACMVPYNKNDPNQKGMETLRDDDGSLLNLEEELYCAWCDVVVNPAATKEKMFGKQPPGFFMYYSTMTKSDKKKCIAFAVSEDGFRWLKRGVILQPSSLGEEIGDDGGCSRCHVMRRASFDTTTRTWNEESGWFMLYEGVSSKDSKHRIFLAESDDGRSWTKKGMVFDVGEGDSWDCGGVGSPHLLRLEDGSTRMYYTGQGKDGSTGIGVAKIPVNGEVSECQREETLVFSF